MTARTPRVDPRRTADDADERIPLARLGTPQRAQREPSRHEDPARAVTQLDERRILGSASAADHVEYCGERFAAGVGVPRQERGERDRAVSIKEREIGVR